MGLDVRISLARAAINFTVFQDAAESPDSSLGHGCFVVGMGVGVTLIHHGQSAIPCDGMDASFRVLPSMGIARCLVETR